MSDEKVFETIRDLPNYGESFSEILLSPKEGPYAVAAELLNQSTGSSRAFMENEFRKVCTAIDIIKYAIHNAENHDIDLFTGTADNQSQSTLKPKEEK